MRYAIGRMSMAPFMVSDYIKSKWDLISNKQQFIKNLEDEIEHCELMGKYSETRNGFGMKCDEDMWKGLLEWMKNSV